MCSTKRCERLRVLRIFLGLCAFFFVGRESIRKEWLGTGARPGPDRPRHNADMLLPNGLGKRQASLFGDFYLRRIQRLLSGVTVPVIASALSISEPYGAEIRADRYLPHPRHWLTLGRLVGVSPDE